MGVRIQRRAGAPEVIPRAGGTAVIFVHQDGIRRFEAWMLHGPATGPAPGQPQPRRGRGRALAAQLRGAQPIALGERGIETAQAAETGGECNLGNRERRFIEQAPRGQQAAGLCNLDGRCAKLCIHHAT